MAGIYNEFKDENRFVILTTGANHSIADVHNRMPVILTERNVEDWITSEDFCIGLYPNGYACSSPGISRTDSQIKRR